MLLFIQGPRQEILLQEKLHTQHQEGQIIRHQSHINYNAARIAVCFL